MKGKDKCKILKEIRARIAEENGIELAISECHHKGDCLGTCPKCESEVRYLEREIEKRKRLGKSALVAGIAAGITLTSVGCTYIEDKLIGEELQGNMIVEETVDGLLPAEDELVEETVGEIPPDDEPLMGEPVEIQGDMAMYFLPDTPDGYEGYDEYFINMSLTGRSISDVEELWADADMKQSRESESIVSYFTDTRDVVIYYGEDGIITKAETIENE